jgi:TctA family transporter
VVFFTRPLSGTLMAVATIVLVSMTLPSLLNLRNKTFEDAEET